MPETKKTIRLLGNDVNVFDVPIKSAVEYFNEYELEDGSKLKVKSVATSFLRVDGEYSADGKPVYLVLTAPAVNVLSSPEIVSRPSPKKAN